MAWRGWVCMVGLVGCGPQVIDENADDGASTSGEEGGSGEESGSGEASSDPSATESGNVESSTGPMVACESYLDAREPGQPIAIQIVNVGEQPVLLDAPCFNADYLDVSTPSGKYWPLGFCSGTCESQFIDGCFACDGCASASYRVVMPGGSVEVEWPGEMYTDVIPPEACFPLGSCGDACPQRIVDIGEVVNVAVAAVAYEDCVAIEPDPSVCTCAEGTDCEQYGSEHIEPSMGAAAIYEPGALGPIVLELGG